jgi:hypothetical protein
MSASIIMAAGSAAVASFNPAVQIGILVSSLVSMAEVFKLKKEPNPNTQTTISLVVGDAPNAEGSVPHVSVWDRDGNRIGQYNGDENGHWGDKSSNTIVIDNIQNGGKPAQPEYLSVVMNEGDAICLSAIFASGNAANWGWTGDMGYACEAQWYPSSFPIGNSNSAPRCVWLDGDKKNGIIANGLSIHIRDFAGDRDIMEQYDKNQTRLCQNSARMTFHHDLIPDGIPNFFKPPLEYTTRTDPNTSGGGLKNPDQGIDRKRRAYEDQAPPLPSKPKSRRSVPQAEDKGITGGIIGVKNNRPSHLVVSEMDHSAKELCEHHASLGPDFVAIKEGIYCDMEAAKWWPLCKDEMGQRCFDLEKKGLRGNIGVAKTLLLGHSINPVPVKSYDSVDVWKSKST